MNTIEVKIDKKIEDEFVAHLNSSDIRYKNKIKLNISPNDVFQYLIVGGGLISIANAISSFIIAKKSTCKLKVQFEDKIIEVEATSEEKLVKLLEKAKGIVLVESAN